MEAWNARWSREHEMQATALDLLHDLLRQFVAANTPKGKERQIPRPWRWPRPHDKPKTVTMREMARRLRG